LRPVPRRLPRANPQAVGPQTPGRPEGFFGGLGSDIIGSAETGACISDLTTCLQYLAAGGEMPSVLYKNWLSSQGVDTSFNSTYGAGEVSGDIIALAIGGAADADTAVGLTADAAEDPVAAEGARSGGPVQIFRNVDAREFDSNAATGKFSPGPGQMEGKWFAMQGAHAEQWGQSLNGGEGITVETRIPASLADQLYLHAGKLDGVGPAYYADGVRLDLINAAMDGIRVWP
jgi:hypothetical protein